jgi:predicted RNA-binding protein
LPAAETEDEGEEEKCVEGKVKRGDLEEKKMNRIRFD